MFSKESFQATQRGLKAGRSNPLYATHLAVKDREINGSGDMI